MFKLSPGTNQDSFANVYDCWDKFEFAEKHQVSLIFELEQFNDLFQVIFEKVIIANNRVHLLLQLEASNLQTLFI